MEQGTAFTSSIASGQLLAHQLRGNGQYPPTHQTMDSTTTTTKENGQLPTCPTVYAVITDMKMFGNSKVDSSDQYPPPALPALVPLTLQNLHLNVECHISTGFVTLKSQWDVNCIRSGVFSNCLLVIPMDNQGTVSSVEVDMGHGRFYTTTVVPRDEAASYGAKGSPKSEVGDPGTYNPEFFRLNIPQVGGGAKLDITVTWFQPMLFADGLYSLRVPLVFPQIMLPVATSLGSITEVRCSINTGTTDPVEAGTFVNSMKEIEREPGIVVFKNDQDKAWQNLDFVASYRVWSDGIFPNLIYQGPEEDESDKRGTFCLSISPPDPNKIKVFQRAVVFLLDRSGSMYGEPIEDALQSLYFGLESLKPEDSFNIIAFDHEVILFSPQMSRATSAALGQAREWATEKCKARGGTDILTPLQQAFQLLENYPDAVPYVFLITDGAVADERNICLTMQKRITALGPRAPRISTFGIGHYCNYYFLKMLAVIGRGISDVAFTSDKIRSQMERMLVAAATPVLTNIVLQRLPENCEVYPFPIPDLFCGNPLVVSGKYHGEFPNSITVTGLMPDQSTWALEVPARRTSKVPISKVFAKQQLDLLTCQAWLYEDKSREQQAVNLSLATGIPCQYTRVIGFETTKAKLQDYKNQKKAGKKVDVKKFTAGKVVGIVLVGGLVIGFGSVAATVANAAVGELVADSLGNVLGEFGGDLGCCGDCGGLLECGECGGLCECLGSCDGFDSCGDIFGSACEVIFGCICGILTGL